MKGHLYILVYIPVNKQRRNEKNEQIAVMDWVLRPPPIHMLKPYLPHHVTACGDTVFQEESGFDEVIRAGPWPSRLVSLYEEEDRSEISHTSCSQKKGQASTQWEDDHFHIQERGPTGNQYMSVGHDALSVTLCLRGPGRLAQSTALQPLVNRRPGQWSSVAGDTAKGRDQTCGPPNVPPRKKSARHTRQKHNKAQ